MSVLRWSSRRSDFAALLFSAVAAALAPLPVFLLAFMLLGPIHYLTEIVWLQSKNFYFREGVLAPRWYALIAIALAIATTIDHFHGGFVGVWTICTLVVISISVLIQNRWMLASIAIAALVVKLFAPSAALLVAVVVPTILHVFVFTWFFMVSGAIRTRNTRFVQWVNPALLLIIPVLLLRLPMHYGLQNARWLNMEHLSFEHVHYYAARHLHRPWVLDGTLLADPVVAAILRVFAFTYTFHYLNWFGKAELLEWHKIPGRTWTVIGIIYAVLMAISWWNFTAGFLLVNFFSLLHVLLEFPLDWQAIRFVTRNWRGKREPAPIAVGT